MSAAASDPHLDCLLDTWAGWGLGLSARPRVLERIRSGRTNRNYRLTAPGREEDLLLRVNHPASGFLGIDRERERRILALTAEAGIGRPCRYWDPRQRFAIFPWLPGRAWTRADFDDSAQLARLWPMIERLHQIDTAGWPRRRYHAYLRRYWQRLEDAGLADRDLRLAWRDFEPRLARFDGSPWSARLVHHDLIPDNILETGRGIHLIDWEYAAPGHPDIDVWSVDPAAVDEPFVAEMMAWINALWERLMAIAGETPVDCGSTPRPP